MSQCSHCNNDTLGCSISCECCKRELWVSTCCIDCRSKQKYCDKCDDDCLCTCLYCSSPPAGTAYLCMNCKLPAWCVKCCGKCSECVHEYCETCCDDDSEDDDPAILDGYNQQLFKPLCPYCEIRAVVVCIFRCKCCNMDLACTKCCGQCEVTCQHDFCLKCREQTPCNCLPGKEFSSDPWLNLHSPLSVINSLKPR